jgi:hypothetical protein
MTQSRQLEWPDDSTPADPKLASFMSLDPVRQHMNPYAYVGWNPVAFTDPTGMIFGLGTDISGHWGGGFTIPLEWSFEYMKSVRMEGKPLSGGFQGGRGGGRGPGGLGGDGPTSGNGAAVSFPASEILQALGTAALGLAIPLLAVLAVAQIPAIVAGTLIGTVAGAAIGSIATGTLAGALGGAAAGALVGGLAGSLPATAAGMIALGLTTGVASATVTAVSQLTAYGGVDATSVATSFMLGVTTGWIGGGFARVFASPLLGAGITAALDIMWAGVTSGPSAATPAAPAAATYRVSVLIAANFETGHVATYVNVPGFGYVGPGMFGEDF